MVILRFLFALGLLAVLSAAAAAQHGPQTQRDQLQADLRALEKYFTRHPSNTSGDPDAGGVSMVQVISRVSGLPEGDDLRYQAICLARRHAKVADLRVARANVLLPYHYQSCSRLIYSWTLLMELQVLQAGMTLEEAIAVLGPATRVADGAATWEYRCPPTVNYDVILRAELKDGRVQTFKHNRS